jgi:hypothetical protein
MEANQTAEELRTSFGLSRTASRQLLSDTGDLLSGFGFTQEAALDLSEQVNKLAVDLASFTNVQGGSQRASRALTKALLGERESVKELGIAILESDVKAKVLELTQQGLTFETNRQAKAYATLQIAMEQSKNAIGDFARTQDSAANRARVAAARLRDIADTIGMALLPAVNDALSVVLDLTEKFAMLTPEVKALGIQLAIVAALAGPTAIGLGGIFKAVSLGLSGIGMLATTLGLVLTPLGAIAAAAIIATSVITKMVGPVDALAVGWEALEQAWAFWVKQFDRGVTFIRIKIKEMRPLAIAADIIGKAWVGLKATFGLVLSGIGVVIRDVANAVAELIGGVQRAAEFLGIGLPDGVEKARQAFASLSDIGKDFAQNNAEAAANTAAEWDNAFESLKGTTETFADATREGFVAVKTVGTEILNILLSESGDKAVEIQALMDKLKNQVINITAKVEVVTPETSSVGPGAEAGSGVAAAVSSRKMATDEIIALAQRQGEAEIEQSKLTAESLAGIEAFRLQTIIDQESEALQTRLDKQKAFAEKVGGVIEGIGAKFGDMFAQAVDGAMEFNEILGEVWKDIRRTFITSIVDITTKWIANSIIRMIQSKAETVAVVSDAAVQATT